MSIYLLYIKSLKKALLLFFLLYSTLLGVRTDTTLILVNKEQKFVDVAGVYHPAYFNGPVGLKQHHFIVWENGKSGKHALFTVYVSDSLIHDALIEASAQPGNNLTLDTWDKRKSKKSSEPDKRVEGSSITIEILHENKTYTVNQILTDKHDNPFDFRFGGNLDFIPHWQSGCVVCLQSCPGGKVGNRSYTIRDLERKIPEFTVNKTLPFKEGDEVLIRFRIH